MLTAISRYGARVLPNTQQIIARMVDERTFVDGPHIEQFEAAFAARLGSGVRAVSASYGRMAFAYILEALDLKPGGEIVLPALTFWVIPEMARAAGFPPVFADVDPFRFTMTPESVARVIGPKTVALVPTHLWGLPCDMDGILEIARARGVAVIEDCAHALGATYKGRPVGTLGDAALFSFQTLKPLNTYGGGMAVARDPAVADRLRARARAEPLPTEASIRTRLWHGRVQRIAIRPRVFTWTLFPVLWASAWMHANPDVYLWEAIRPLDPLPPGYAERYSNVQAALGLEALAHLDAWTSATQANARRITDALAGLAGVALPIVPADRTHAFYQYCAYVPDRDRLVHYSVKHGVDLETLHVDVCPHLELFERYDAPCPGADATERAVQIPVYASLTTAELDRLIGVVSDAIEAGSRQSPVITRQSSAHD